MTDKRLLLLFFLLVLLNGLDVVTTTLGLKIGAAENMQLSSDIMKSVGFVHAMLLKFFCVLFLSFMGLLTYWFAFKYDPKYLRHTRAILLFVFAVGVGFYLYVMVSNVIVIWLQLNF